MSTYRSRYREFVSVVILMALLMMAKTPVWAGTAAQKYVAVAAGENHTLALSDGGGVWAWGSNYSGQLGNGTKKAVKDPELLASTSEVKYIAIASENTLAVKGDGSVWSWGYNDYGQLGDGTTETRYLPVQVQGLLNVKAVALGPTHAIALTTDGSVWTWGRNLYGQLGDRSEARMRTAPYQIASLKHVKAVAAGGRHSLALAEDGTVWGWGDSESGQLGLGRKSDSDLPIQIPGLTGIVAIAAGAYHSVAIDTQGNVWTWGDNEYGQLGIGSTTKSSVPILVKTLNDVVAAAAGQNHTLFLRKDGTVWSCGYNNYGQLGSSSKGSATVPMQIQKISDVTGIAAGKYHSVALRSDGTVWAWGNNNDYQLGYKSGDDTWQPVQVLPVEVTKVETNEVSQTTQPNKEAADGSTALSSDNQQPPPTNNVDEQETPIDTVMSDTTEHRKPKVVLVLEDALSKLEGSKYLYNGKVVLDEVSTTLEWAAISPDGRFVAYKTDRDIMLYDIARKQRQSVYHMTMDEWAGQWIYNYGFIPGYWFKFVGWTVDSSSFVVDKDYPGLFKGGTGYYLVNVSSGEMTSIADEDVAIRQ